jgi:hypothetical protein
MRNGEEKVKETSKVNNKRKDLCESQNIPFVALHDEEGAMISKLAELKTLAKAKTWRRQLVEGLFKNHYFSCLSFFKSHGHEDKLRSKFMCGHTSNGRVQ